MSSLSVVIPTYNRKDILQRTLEGLAAQSAWADIDEILVIDDGSTDGTNRLVADYTRCSRVPVRSFRQSNLGQAAARNVGIREAQSSILLFLDDDIVPSPALVTEHLAWHDRHPEPHMGVLGFVTWAPEVRATPFMEWLGLDGPLWAYAHFKPGSRLDFHAFYTCNLIRRQRSRPILDGAQKSERDLNQEPGENPLERRSRSSFCCIKAPHGFARPTALVSLSRLL